MKNTLSPRNLLALASAHKVASVIIAAIVLLSGYWTMKTFAAGPAETRYVTAQAAQGTIIASVSGSGQVAAMSQVDLKPKVSGDIVYVGVTQGQVVKQGQLIAEIDPTDAERSLRNAQAGLTGSQISLEKLTEAADPLTLAQDQDSVAQAEQSVQNAETALASDYSDAYTNISNAFVDMPAIVTGDDNVLFGFSYLPGQENINYYYDQVKDIDPNSQTYYNAANNDYTTAKTAYDQNFLDYQNTLRTSGTSTIAALLDETYNTSLELSQSLHSSNNFLSFVKDALTTQNKTIPNFLPTQSTSITTYTGTLDGDISKLLSSKNTLVNDQNALVNAQTSLSEKQLALQKLQAGADPLDVQSSQLSVEQQQNSVATAEENLADYYIRAPFDGTVAKLDVKKGDSASSGTAIATMVTPEQMAQLTLNEVDAAKVKVGQKATLTFDAIPDLTIAGQVAEADTVGTVAQGVVSYGVQIAFATQDARVKPGMSVNASIVTDEKPDALIVPSSAVKTSGGTSYVQVFDTPPAGSTSSSGAPSATPPTQVMVTTGLSSDSSVEIVSGLTAGQYVVTRTITGTTQPSQSSAPSLLGGGGRGGGFRPGAGV